MTRWAMIADLERCVGCQTCTAACKHTNATSPAVQWRKVLDMELGTYPDVKRVFVPVGCMHCEDPPCMHVCPSTATGRRDDGIVTIDYDLCIGCAYCAVACPYQARFKVNGPSFAYGGDGQMKNEAAREDPARFGVAQKCTFCADRIDYGLENDLTPGVDPLATPACVNSCIAGALHFGDLDDPASNVSGLLDSHKTFRMHEQLGTDPGFHYIWKRNDGNDGDSEKDETVHIPATATGNVGSAKPWLQQHWDWRAAANFICGGSGSGMMLALAAMATIEFVPDWLLLVPLGFIGAGLFFVWLETGRPFRAPLNVFFNPWTSWMSRESIAAAVLFPVTLAAIGLASDLFFFIAVLLAAVFLYCQARLIKASKGIPVWRNPAVVGFIIATGLTEGWSLLMMASPPSSPPSSLNEMLAGGLVVLLITRLLMWRRYLKALQGNAPTAALKVLQKYNTAFILVSHTLPIAVIGVDMIWSGVSVYGLGAAGFFALIGGWVMKYILITKASWNQGYEIVHTPERGLGGSGPGGQPGWGQAS